MNILVIGGTRFIGAHVVRALHEAGASITVLHRGRSSNPILPQVRHVVDPRAEFPVTEFPPAVLQDWDVVIHMVPMGQVDGSVAVEAFRGRVGRMVFISSCDVYRAHGRLTQLEPGVPDPLPLAEGAPLRMRFYPYRGMEEQLGSYAHDYEKILAEAAVQEAADLEWTILRLPKVYGPEDNADLATVYGFAEVPHWRWTHGHVTNIARAIAVAAGHPLARNAVYNLGEEITPTMGERLALLPPRMKPEQALPPFDYRQSLVTDSRRVREELGYRDIIDERAAMSDLAKLSSSSDRAAGRAPADRSRSPGTS